MINSGADGQIRFGIDNHTLQVIATDFVPIQRYNTTTVTLGIGQRMDVLVTADQNADAFWMRASIPGFTSNSGCSLNFQPDALAAIYYDGADTDSVPPDNSQTFPDPTQCIEDVRLFLPHVNLDLRILIFAG